MKNTALAELNFNNLLHYGCQPERRGKFSSAVQCSGFCISCEKKGFLHADNHRLDQMSHGADTDDFEQAIHPLPEDGVKVPIAFLLESPGGDYGNGSQISFEGITKRPPVNHYYWTPKDLTEWPYDPSSAVPKSYGPYFAYLFAAHKLHNAYFTNIIKCSLVPSNANRFKEYYVAKDPNLRDSKIRTNCYELFLRKEMELVSPEVVFFFGTKAARMGRLEGLHSLLPEARFVTLYHPAARYMNPSRIVEQNDKRIDESLRDVLRNL